METRYAVAGFVIPHFKTEQNPFILEKGILFTQRNCVHYGMTALSSLVDLPGTCLSILFCVDSKDTMFALNNADNKFRSDIIFEIRYMIPCLLVKGIIVDCCWVPSHCGLFG